MIKLEIKTTEMTHGDKPNAEYDLCLNIDNDAKHSIGVYYHHNHEINDGIKSMMAKIEYLQKAIPFIRIENINENYILQTWIDGLTN